MVYFSTMITENAYRFDRGTVEPIEQGDGFLRCKVTIAKSGVFPYLYPDGSIRLEAKLPEELFSEITLNTAKGVPVTDGHPPITDSAGLITPENAQKYVKGSISDTITVNGPYLETHETIYNADLIKDLKAGRKREVSIGFKTNIDHTPGEFNGQRYDAAQRNIRINHVGHVEAGRAGSDVCIHLDAALNNGTEIAVQQQENNKGAFMEKILEGIKNLLDQIKRDSSEPSKQEPAAGAANNSTASDPKDQEISRLKLQIQALEQMLQEKTKLLDEALSPATQDSLLSKRMKLVDTAKGIIPDLKHDGLSDRELKLKVIAATLPFDASVKMDSVDEAIVNARFDASAELARSRAALQGSSSSRMDENDAVKKIQESKNKRLNLANKGAN